MDVFLTYTELYNNIICAIDIAYSKNIACTIEYSYTLFSIKVYV